MLSGEPGSASVGERERATFEFGRDDPLVRHAVEDGEAAGSSQGPWLRLQRTRPGPFAGKVPIRAACVGPVAGKRSIPLARTATDAV